MANTSSQTAQASKPKQRTILRLKRRREDDEEPVIILYEKRRKRRRMITSNALSKSFNNACSLTLDNSTATPNNTPKDSHISHTYQQANEPFKFQFDPQKYSPQKGGANTDKKDEEDVEYTETKKVFRLVSSNHKKEEFDMIRKQLRHSFQHTSNYINENRSNRLKEHENQQYNRRKELLRKYERPRSSLLEDEPSMNDRGISAKIRNVSANLARRNDLYRKTYHPCMQLKPRPVTTNEDDFEPQLTFGDTHSDDLRAGDANGGEIRRKRRHKDKENSEWKPRDHLAYRTQKQRSKDRMRYSGINVLDMDSHMDMDGLDSARGDENDIENLLHVIDVAKFGSKRDGFRILPTRSKKKRRYVRAANLEMIKEDERQMAVDEKTNDENDVFDIYVCDELANAEMLLREFEEKYKLSKKKKAPPIVYSRQETTEVVLMDDESDTDEGPDCDAYNDPDSEHWWGNDYPAKSSAFLTLDESDEESSSNLSGKETKTESSSRKNLRAFREDFIRQQKEFANQFDEEEVADWEHMQECNRPKPRGLYHTVREAREAALWFHRENESPTWKQQEPSYEMTHEHEYSDLYDQLGFQ